MAYPSEPLGAVLSLGLAITLAAGRSISHKLPKILTSFVRLLQGGSSSTQATGSHQRIGDILLRNMLQLKVAWACVKLWA